MSAPHANAAAARSPIARIPAARPSSGPRSATASRASSTPSGSGGSSWPGAATTTTGAAASATTPATRTTSGTPPQSMSAFGSPILLDRPPASTIPPRRARAAQWLSLGAWRRRGRRFGSAAAGALTTSPRTLRPADVRSAVSSRPDAAGSGGGASVVAGAERVIPIRRQAREDGMRWGLAPEGWGVLGTATVTLSTRARQAVPTFPTAATSQCAPSSCGRARGLHSFRAISTRLSTGRLRRP